MANAVVGDSGALREDEVFNVHERTYKLKSRICKLRPREVQKAYEMRT
jgi:hypothetical protein